MAKVRADNQKLVATVDAMRGELRAERRKRRDLENQLAILEDRLETAVLQPRDDRPPSLPVEVLSPSDESEGRVVATTDDGTEIVYVDEANAPPVALEPARAVAPGRRNAAMVDKKPLRDLPTSTRLTAGDRPGAGEEPAAGTGDPALELYRRGTDALRGGDHAAAVAAFRDVVARFPRHEYADNAQYWLGEAFYDQRDYARAIAEFRATVAHYPRGNKVPDALLKIGFSYQALGDATKARAALEQVVAVYPGSSPAAIASARLQSL